MSERCEVLADMLQATTDLYNAQHEMTKGPRADRSFIARCVDSAARRIDDAVDSYAATPSRAELTVMPYADLAALDRLVFDVRLKRARTYNLNGEKP